MPPLPPSRSRPTPRTTRAPMPTASSHGSSSPAATPPDRPGAMTEQGIVDRPAVDAEDAAADGGRLGLEAPTAPSPGRSELTPGGILTRRQVVPFEVHLDVFSGPFDLLL